MLMLSPWGGPSITVKEPVSPLDATPPASPGLQQRRVRYRSFRAQPPWLSEVPVHPFLKEKALCQVRDRPYLAVVPSAFPPEVWGLHMGRCKEAWPLSPHVQERRVPWK